MIFFPVSPPPPPIGGREKEFFFFKFLVFFFGVKRVFFCHWWEGREEGCGGKGGELQLVLLSIEREGRRREKM